MGFKARIRLDIEIEIGLEFNQSEERNRDSAEEWKIINHLYLRRSLYSYYYILCNYIITNNLFIVENNRQFNTNCSFGKHIAQIL